MGVWFLWRGRGLCVAYAQATSLWVALRFPLHVCVSFFFSGRVRARSSPFFFAFPLCCISLDDWHGRGRRWVGIFRPPFPSPTRCVLARLLWCGVGRLGSPCGCTPVYLLLFLFPRRSDRLPKALSAPGGHSRQLNVELAQPREGRAIPLRGSPTPQSPQRRGLPRAQRGAGGEGGSPSQVAREVGVGQVKVGIP